MGTSALHLHIPQLYNYILCAHAVIAFGSIKFDSSPGPNNAQRNLKTARSIEVQKLKVKLEAKNYPKIYRSTDWYIAFSNNNV